MKQGLYIKPRTGMTIPHPDTLEPIGEEGAWVPNSAFYRRFVARSEADETGPPRTARKPKPPTRPGNKASGDRAAKD